MTRIAELEYVQVEAIGSVRDVTGVNELREDRPGLPFDGIHERASCSTWLAPPVADEGERWWMMHQLH
jgi:hypothetical protein